MNSFSCPLFSKEIGFGLVLLSLTDSMTYIGNVLVSVNPYKGLALYTPAIADAYERFSRFELPPHIYAIADDSYCSMKNKNLDQCVIISGESGSGKTEAGKLIMQYIAAITGRSKKVQKINMQLLESNPVMEAFGNAKTNRNDNSSRFGKYIDIEFDFKGDPIGGTITNSNSYCEKYFSRGTRQSRITSTPVGQRNFHVFYQLLTGSDVHLLKTLKLKRNLGHYRLLNISNCLQVDSIDDRLEYMSTKRALNTIGFSENEVLLVFQLISAVLKLGNLDFRPHANLDGTEGCIILNDYELIDVCELLKIEYSHLQSALVQRTIETRHDFIVADLTDVEAAGARDALCKAIYTRLFSWLINRLNESIKPKKHGKMKLLGILDIYGFEIFEKNGFEQFVINYCNEKLQQLFMELMLKDEQEEYIKEGIHWEQITHFDNSIICDLIEKNNYGIFSILDEEYLRSNAVDDKSLLDKLNTTFVDHPHFETVYPTDSSSESSSLSSNQFNFRIRHYAGSVTYSIVGFLEKNSDHFSRDLSQAMFQSEHELLKSLFLEGNPKKTTLKRRATAVTQFKISIGALMKNLKSKNPNYIRCIKPNELKQPQIFEKALVHHQIKYLGLMENLRVRRAGYAFRQTFESFLYRYKMLSIHTWPSWDGPPMKGVTVLLKGLPIHSAEYVYGRTKIYIKNYHTVFELEEFRQARLGDLALLIQKVYRGWIMRTKYKQSFKLMRSSQIVIAKYFRGWMARMLFKQLLHKKEIERATIVIQRYYHGWKKKRYLYYLSKNLPSESPLCTHWPFAPRILADTSKLLQNLYHKWRCIKYKHKFDQIARNRMREKVTASLIFKNRKSCYPRTVSHPFRGDYVRLRQNLKWKKLSSEAHDEYVVFADILNKVTRTNGKCVPILLVVSTSSMLVMDQRTLQIKYRIPAPEIYRISLSPFSDDVAVIHVKPTALIQRKGDFIFQTGHVIEIVTKIFLVVKNAVGKHPEIQITPEFEAKFGSQNVVISFKSNCTSDSQMNQLKVLRRGNKLEVYS
ncbi:Unconventional myosin-Ib [Nymphon striatum]|nr:Unconventional myosin-Ib [Nymphon striatum]